MFPSSENSAWFWLIGSSWPSQLAQPSGAKLKAKARISPMYWSAISGSLRQGGQGQHLVDEVRGQQRGGLGVGVVGGRDLDEVEAGEREAPQRAQEGDRLVREQAADLGRAGGRSERGVDDVDVEGQERRTVAHPRPHPL